MAKPITVVVRQRRQITLPAEIYEQLDLQVGDRLELRIEDEALIIRAKKDIAFDALQAIRQSFAESGISEEELQEAGRAVRRHIVREKYGQ